MIKKFSFGKVKGMEMLYVLNMEKIHSNFSGLQYLYGMRDITKHEYIKEEIEYCFRTYAKDYIIRFGKYKGMTLSEIDYKNQGYVENYLPKNDSEEIKEIVKYYLKYCRNKVRKEYNSYQEYVFSSYNDLITKINERHRQQDVIKVLENMGYGFKRNIFKHCPFGCETKKRFYEHAYLLYGYDGSWFIHCCRCGTSTNFIKFVSNQLNVEYTEAIDYIANMMGLTLNVHTQKREVKDIKRTIVNKNDSITLVTKRLPEINLKDFGFRKGVYPPYFYKRGFTEEDAEKMEVYYGGRYSKNQFKRRICFIVRDLNNRAVGVVGRSQYEEKEYYDNMVRYYRIDKSLSRGEQIKKLKNMGKGYKKYYNKLKSSQVLYNANSLVGKSIDKFYICEGPFDVMKMVCSHGYKNTVGMFSNILKDGQLYQLYRLFKDVRDKIKIYLFVDRDEAGLKAFEGNVKKLQELGFKNIYKMVLNNGKDAAEATKEEVDKAYKNAELQSIRYNKKKIILLNEDIGERTVLEK